MIKKMSDVFELPVSAEQHEEFHGWWTVDVASGKSIDESGDGGFEEATAKAISIALNNHDKHVQRIQELTDRIEELEAFLRWAKREGGTERDFEMALSGD